ncbi:MAG: GntR family transcriptional regulator [Butyrivibrio sp.]|uniref:GntR family transcriptional regulator n=1 Tax=Butyrivibrio sp. XB500-5 TaxID=2364880 RepID=UPI000EA85CF6|nr:GntR family transcriptional regulator [Butyrivibrio sp. XB500-5]MBR4670300.1 GntR family transcriptional regulator [Butyrivibrio sp.]RKM61714.1 GntR family transcriptional regulator [Butyrivibrio sp. XB500-5]
MLDSNLPVSLQYQLREVLFEKLNSGEWKAGEMIPSEHELCEEYGVSRITVREVLKELVQSGYLKRKQGKGTFVSKPSVEATLVSNYSLSADLKQKGISSEFKLISLEVVDPSPSKKEFFELADGEKLFEIIRTRTIKDEIYAWEKAYVPEKYLKGLTEEEIQSKGLYPSIKERTGLYPIEAEEKMEAVICPAYVAKQMNLPTNTAVFKIKRNTKSMNGYIEKCESYLVGQTYNIKHIIKNGI